MEPSVFVLAISMATSNGRPVAEQEWVADQITEANRLFAAAGIQFRSEAGPAFAERLASAETRADRNAIGDTVYARGFVSVAIVQSLRDVDEPSRFRMGVCWRNERDPQKRYLIVSREASPAVLAHELGHLFGNPHSGVRNNLMSYLRDANALPFLDSVQIARVRRTAADHVVSGFLSLTPSR